MTGIYCDYGCNGVLTINTVPLAGPAWDVPLLAMLWMEHTVRGENLVLPGAAGRLSFPTRLDEGVHTLNLWVNGDVDRTGAPYLAAATANGQAIDLNLQYLLTNVFVPGGTGPPRGVLPATLLKPGGTTLTANVQVSPLRIVGAFDTRETLFSFTLTIPDGKFV